MSDTKPPQSLDHPEVLSHIDRSKVNLLEYIQARVEGVDADVIGKAVEFSILAHKNQFRKSGLPYIEHPFEVAKILAEFHMDTTTIVAGLLHDVVEDTDTTAEDIAKDFGEDVGFLVEGVTKISALQERSKIAQQAETYRKMLLSMAKDFRVIMIKFADRLHNMRTLSYMKEEKKKLIARETMDVYAPLAHRFGLSKIRWELEDLAFKYINPDAYNHLVKSVMARREEREAYIRSLITPVQEALKSGGTNVKVYGRPKHFYSIYKKMESRNCKFEDVFDILAIRIIVETIAQCYEVLGVMHNLWPPLQTRFKDFIATPKSNSYQSLHTTLVGPEGKPIEIQIRTQEMDLTAEHGIAAHWSYKEGKVRTKMENESKWLTQFMDWQKDLKDSTEFMEFFRVDLNSDEILIFNPDGDLKQLPQGATALDFAYDVHTQVGNYCIGAKVDGKLVPMDKVLQTGCTVEILKSPAQHPSRDWLRIATTPKAKGQIRKWLKSEEKNESIQLGKQLLKREFQSLNYPVNLRDRLETFESKFSVTSWEQFYQKLGSGEIALDALADCLVESNPKSSKGVLDRVIPDKFKSKGDKILISAMDHILFKNSNCCQPVPGDDVVGTITKGKGVSVHRVKCSKLKDLYKNAERVVPVEWKKETYEPQSVFVELKAKDKTGLLYEITDVFSTCGIDVERASIVTVRNRVRNRFKIKVSTIFQLNTAFAKLRKIKGVNSVMRKSLASESDNQEN